MNTQLPTMNTQLPKAKASRRTKKLDGSRAKPSNAPPISFSVTIFLLRGPVIGTVCLGSDGRAVYRAGPSRWAALWIEHAPYLRAYAAAHHIAPGSDGLFFAERRAQSPEKKIAFRYRVTR